MLLLSSTQTGLAQNGKGKLSHDLRSAKTDVDVIVQFNTPPNSNILKAITKLGGNLKWVSVSGNTVVFHLPPQVAAALENNPFVKYATPDRKIGSYLDFARPAVNATIAQQSGYNGTGVGVAIIDSGIKADNDFKSIVYSESFVPNDSSTSDAFGHGTHVAGIVASQAVDSSCANCTVQFKGIAPGVKLINLRVLDANGQGSDSAVIAAIDRAIQLKSTYNIRVINLSVGRMVHESYATDPLCQAVERAWKAGIFVAVAAGNNGRDNSMGTNGYATITSPGNDPYVMTVGAMRDMGTASRADDLIATYSSKGPTLFDHVVKPDIVAPGNHIISVLASANALTTNFPNNAVPLSYYRTTTSNYRSGDYFWLSGTSMAAPMVSGAAALLLQKDPTLTPDSIKARLMKTASKSFPTVSVTTDATTGLTYTSQYDMFTTGAGYLDVWAALNNSDSIASTKNALSPTVVRNATTGRVSIVNGTSVVWGDSIVWGDSVVWGANVFVSGTSIVWGDSVVWGDSTVVGNSIVWGDSVVWGDSSPFSLSLSIQGDN